MSLTLQNKIVLVTGGSSGIGLASARRFAAEGAHVFITGRRQAELDAAVIKIGANVTAIRADSADLADMDAVVRTIRESKGHLDVLMANAGILEKAPVGEMSEEHFDRIFSTNVKGMVFTVQKALPLLVDGASIILMSSAVANKGMGANSLYAATKAAIRSFARGWIMDLKTRQIRVNSISPGPIQTPGLTNSIPDQSKVDTVFSHIASQIPLGRLGTADEIANVAAFLASEQASFVNGADLQVDGGWAQI